MRIAGKQDGTDPIIYGPHRAPRIAKNATILILWPMYEKNCFLCYTYVCSMMRSYWKFSFTWVRHKGPPGPPPPPNMKKSTFLHILGLSFKISYQIAPLFEMYIDMGERIAGKQYRPSLIIEHPFRAPQIAQNIHIFWHFGTYRKNWFSNCFLLLYLCLHCDEVWICWHFGAPAIPGFYVWAQHRPRKNQFFFSYFLF